MLEIVLDDSGTDRQNRLITIAGYIAPVEQWRLFETEVEAVFAKHGVKILHAMHLEDTDGEFKDWRVLRKQAFVAEICSTLAQYSPLGMSMSALKSIYKQRAAESGRKRTVTPYTFAFNVIIDWILRDVQFGLGRTAHAEGVSFVLERGNKNDREVEQQFHSVRKLHKLDGVLRDIRFVDKASCRAIQVADLLAFYTRRHNTVLEAAPAGKRAEVEIETMMKIIAERPPVRAFVSTDFGSYLPVLTPGPKAA